MHAHAPYDDTTPPNTRCTSPGSCDHGNLPDDLDRYQAVLFDWDGTLVDSHPLNYRSLSTACAQWGLTMEESFYTDRIGTSGAELIIELAARSETTVPVDTVVAASLEIILKEVATLQPYPPVARLAELLHHHLPLAIASGGPRRSVHAGLHATGLRRLFRHVIAGEDAPRGKPDPSLFLIAAERLGVNPTRCLVYEDSSEGVQAAHAASMQVVDVRCFRGYPVRI
ncbi:MAG TPA: HAD family phosphatase [Streptomyces sp.]|nr:HAD family phosphatase [Streptomyces sp.]